MVAAVAVATVAPGSRATTATLGTATTAGSASSTSAGATRCRFELPMRAFEGTRMRNGGESLRVPGHRGTVTESMDGTAAAMAGSANSLATAAAALTCTSSIGSGQIGLDGRLRGESGKPAAIGTTAGMGEDCIDSAKKEGN